LKVAVTQFRPVKEPIVDTDQEKRTLLAVGLCMLVYLVWMQFFSPPMDTVNPAVSVDDLNLTTTQAKPADDPVGHNPSVSVSPGDNGDNEAANTGAQTPTVAAISPHGLELETDAFKGLVHSTEGALKAVELKDYNAQSVVTPLYAWIFDGAEGEWISYQGGDEPETLLSAAGALVVAGAGELGNDVSYQITKDGAGILASSRLHDGLKITKHYTTVERDEQSMAVAVTFSNHSERVIRDLWVGMADVADGTKADRFANVIRPIAFVDESLERVDDLEELKDEGAQRFEGLVDWFGLGNKYFMSVLAPLDAPPGEWVVSTLSDGRVGSYFRLRQPLDSGASRTLNFVTYIGPKDLDKTTATGHNLDRSIEFGWFGMFAKILLSMLKFFHGLVGNWGLAILLLTCTVKAVFFPLMQKQFVSSKRMQAIQPQVKAIKEKYKDNSQLQSQMTMELFKEHGVNPMSGCLPMIIQMPVWFALYNVMLYSVELYGTSFLYLQDLTEADPTGLLPLVVTVLMVLQQKLMPTASMDPMQQKMMRLMPIGFGIFMFTFPAGLVLYFSVNNMLTIVQQWFIYRKKEEPVSA
jgi:YidC/Oxa1 family membrane protein insertase